jgi:molybdate transport system substrate-binding protein
MVRFPSMTARVTVFLGLLLFGGPAVGEGAGPQPLRVLVASSLQPLLESMRPVIEQKIGGRMELIGAASSVLARQIRNGISADVFIAADKKWARAAVNGGDKSVAGVPQLWMTDEMVLFARVGQRFGDLSGAPLSVALGEPTTVPLGAAATRLLPLVASQLPASKRRLIFGNSALAVLRYVESGAADYGFATRSLIRQRSGLQTMRSFADEPDGRIQYWLTVQPSVSSSKPAVSPIDLFFGREVERLAVEWGLTPAHGDGSRGYSSAL